jgi:hypothetical protein
MLFRIKKNKQKKQTNKPNVYNYESPTWNIYDYSTSLSISSLAFSK